MTGIAIVIIVGAYSLGVWGYCMVRGYEISYPDLWKTTPPKWPPDTMPPDKIYPGGTGQAFGSNPDPGSTTQGSTAPTGVTPGGTTGRGA